MNQKMHKPYAMPVTISLENPAAASIMYSLINELIQEEHFRLKLADHPTNGNTSVFMLQVKYNDTWLTINQQEMTLPEQPEQPDPTDPTDPTDPSPSPL